jgi:dTDP-4-amino-4,6-dideoxygalactose transaminase
MMRCNSVKLKTLNVASRVAEQLLRLPLFPDMTDDEVRTVAHAVIQNFVTCEEERLENW